MQYEYCCGAVVYTMEGGERKYVIVHQLSGYHGFPKGHVESGETEEETALREIFEEAGLRPTLVPGFRTGDEYLIRRHPDVTKRIVYFLAEYAGQPIDANLTELFGVALMTYDEAMALFEKESSKRILTEANDFLNRG